MDPRRAFSLLAALVDLYSRRCIFEEESLSHFGNSDASSVSYGGGLTSSGYLCCARSLSRAAEEFSSTVCRLCCLSLGISRVIGDVFLVCFPSGLCFEISLCRNYRCLFCRSLFMLPRFQKSTELMARYSSLLYFFTFSHSLNNTVKYPNFQSLVC